MTTMNKLNSAQKIPSDLSILSENEQSKIKGGWLWYCEEKRRTILGKPYKTTVWKLKDDGKIATTVQR